MFRLKYLTVRKCIRNLARILSGIQENLFLEENENMNIQLDSYNIFN